jgi:hypothetical protein
MIDKLYNKYFQKSKSFLYPTLGIKRNSYASPLNTYLSLEGRIGAHECRLICLFKKDDSDRYKEFEENMIVGCPLYLEKIETEDAIIYVFNLEIYESDYFNVILGKYSKLSNVLKKAIREYFGDKSKEYSYIETFLYPDKYYAVYAKLLDMDVSIIESTKELCNPADLEQETLKINKENLEVIEKTL